MAKNVSLLPADRDLAADIGRKTWAEANRENGYFSILKHAEETAAETLSGSMLALSKRAVELTSARDMDGKLIVTIATAPIFDALCAAAEVAIKAAIVEQHESKIAQREEMEKNGRGLEADVLDLPKEGDKPPSISEVYRPWQVYKSQVRACLDERKLSPFDFDSVMAMRTELARLRRVDAEAEAARKAAEAEAHAIDNGEAGEGGTEEGGERQPGPADVTTPEDAVTAAVQATTESRRKPTITEPMMAVLLRLNKLIPELGETDQNELAARMVDVLEQFEAEVFAAMQGQHDAPAPSAPEPASEPAIAEEPEHVTEATKGNKKKGRKAA